MSFIHGKVEEQRKNHKGYLAGSFFSKDSLDYDKDIEINYSKLPDNFTAAKHVHGKSKTWVIVTKGKMYFNIDDQSVEVEEGEFVIFSANTPEEVVKVDPGTESITIHVPSIPGGDKVVLD